MLENPRAKNEGGCTGCFKNCFCCLGIIIVVAFAVFFFAAIWLVNGYKNWEKENKELLSGFTDGYTEEQRSDLYSNLENFQESEVEKESLAMNCDDLGLILDEVLANSLKNLKVGAVGAVCGNRNLDIYARSDYGFWFVFKVWQRSEGSVDFVVYDVKIGPYSIGSVTFGSITEKMTDGINDGLDLILGDGFSGRKITEVYLTEDGIRIVGEL